MIPNIILGLLLLLAGRKLFWLSVGIVGFLFGMQYATEFLTPFLPPGNEWVVFVFAVFLGILAAALAPVFEWIGILAMGFLGGGYFLMNIFSWVTNEPQVAWWVFIVGGIFGVLVMAVTFDWALIIISSLVGTILIIQQPIIEEPLRSILFICTVVLGVWVQYLTSGPFTEEDKASTENKS